MVIEGTVAEWEKWTGMRFPETSGYVVPEALDVVSLEPMMAPVAALSTGDDLRVAQPGERVGATFRVRVT